MFPVKVVIISLTRSLSRRIQVTQSLIGAKFDWQFLDAVDGLQMHGTPPEYHENKVKRLLGFPLSISEVACFLSHRLAWAKCCELNRITLILEDDFVFNTNLEEILTISISTFDDWDILRLQGLSDSSDLTVANYGSIKIVKNCQDPLGATAYLIKPEGAKKLINCSQDIYEPLDHFLEHHKKHNLRICAVKPYPITARGFDSTILDRPDRKPIKGIRKGIRSLHRYFDRITSQNPWFPK